MRPTPKRSCFAFECYSFKSITLCIRNVFKKKKKKEIAYERDIDWDKNGKTARRRSNRIKTEKDP